MAHANPEALKLPDSLLVRYFRRGETDHIKEVTHPDGSRVRVQLDERAGSRTDHWRDLGGGLGYVPDGD